MDTPRLDCTMSTPSGGVANSQRDRMLGARPNVICTSAHIGKSARANSLVGTSLSAQIVRGRKRGRFWNTGSRDVQSAGVGDQGSRPHHWTSNFI